jgi:L-fuconolactonase
MRIDSHNHFWKYKAADYAWMQERGLEMLRKNYLPPELRMETDEADIDGVITVQARQTLDETRWLLQLAAESNFIKGVVGWLPLASPELDAALEEFAGAQRLRGVRHVLHDEKDDRYMLRPRFNEGVARLKELGLVYDILVLERHLPQTIQFVDMHPEQPFVLNHLGKPQISTGELQPWESNIRELAQREHVTCKVSGMVTEAEWIGWDADALAPYFDVVLDAFGPERLMFGSDWPVCMVAAEYQEWLKALEDLASGLADDEFKALFGNTAQRVYGLK